MVQGIFISGDSIVHQDRDEQNGWHSFKGHLPHMQWKDRGREQLHKRTETKFIRIPGLRLLRLSDMGADPQGFPVWKAVRRKLRQTLFKKESLQPEASEADYLQAS